MSYGIEILSPDGYSYVLEGYSCFKLVSREVLTVVRGSGSPASVTVPLLTDKFLVFVRYLDDRCTRVSTSLSGLNLTVTSEFRTGIGTLPDSLSCVVYIFSDYKQYTKETYGIEIFDAAGNVVFDASTRSLNLMFATDKDLPITGGSYAVTYTPVYTGQVGVIGQGQPVVGDRIPAARGNSITSDAFITSILPSGVSVLSSKYAGNFAYINTALYD